MKEETKSSYARNILISIATTIGIILLLLNVIVILLPPPLEYKDLPLKVTPSGFSSGDVTYFDVTGTRCATDPFQDHVTYHYNITIVNADTNKELVSVPGSDITIPTGCSTSTIRNFVIPSFIPPGRYYLKGTNEAYGRWKGTVEVSWYSDVFELDESHDNSTRS